MTYTINVAILGALTSLYGLCVAVPVPVPAPMEFDPYGGGFYYPRESGSATPRIRGRTAQDSADLRHSRRPDYGEEASSAHYHTSIFDAGRAPYREEVNFWSSYPMNIPSGPSHPMGIAEQMGYMSLARHRASQGQEAPPTPRLQRQNQDAWTSRASQQQHESSSTTGTHAGPLTEDEEVNVPQLRIPSGVKRESLPQVWKYLSPEARKEVVYNIFKNTNLNYFEILGDCRLSLTDSIMKKLDSGSHAKVKKALNALFGHYRAKSYERPAWTQELSSEESLEAVKFVASIRGQGRDQVRQLFHRQGYTPEMIRALVDAPTWEDRRIVAREMGLVSY
ncbi:hypothetical protein CBS101457_000301 [Exobasidium rhododendri]|nr:hypothetical protein CBS101457_000301 [Exobasidium rhododendri]